MLDNENVTEYLLSSVVRKIATAVSRVHSKRIIHGSITPEAVVCCETALGRNKEHKDFALKLTGFRGSVKLREGEDEGVPCIGICDSTYEDMFTPPEMRQSAALRKCTAKSDVWSLGCVLYALISCTDTMDLSFTGSEWLNVSTEARDVISKCLASAPEDRIDIAGVLNHPWILRSDLVSQEPFPEENKIKLRELAVRRKTKRILFDAGIDFANDDTVRSKLESLTDQHVDPEEVVTVSKLVELMDQSEITSFPSRYVFSAFDAERTGPYSFMYSELVLPY